MFAVTAVWLLITAPSAGLTIWTVTVPGGGGGGGAAFTVTVTVLLVVNWLSVALSCNRYVPAPGNVALVTAVCGEENVTPAGPLNSLQVMVRVPFGNPSSVALPFR